MTANKRQTEIFEHLKQAGSANVSTLAELFNVSEMTIRRDLMALEDASLVIRKHGKAVLAKEEELSIRFATRADSNYEKKSAIAQQTIPLLQKAKILYLDGSSTAFCLLQFLPQNQNYTIYTNSYAVFQAICKMPNIHPFIIGGFLAEDNNTLDDETSRDVAKHIYVDVAVLSCYGFSYEGLFNNAYTGTEVRRIILENAAETIVLADSTKAFTRGIYLFSSWDSVNYLVTDKPLPTQLDAAIRDQNVTIVDH